MLFGKYLNKYYKKFGLGIILGIIFLIAVDTIQLFIPDLIGKLVELFEDGYNPEKVAQQVQFYGLEILIISLSIRRRTKNSTSLEGSIRRDPVSSSRAQLQYRIT